MSDPARYSPDAVSLAKVAVAALDAQRRYFDCPPATPEKHRLLLEARDWERRLRERCREVLTPPAPNLFDLLEGA